MKKNESMKKGIVVILVANIINLLISLVRNFILPKYLPIDTYADIKFYQLVLSYGGLMAVGFIDGMYIKYGGKTIDEIDVIDFRNNLATFRILELVIVICSVAVGLFVNSYIIVLAVLSIFAINIADYYKCFFQATGMFSYYTRILNASTIMLFLMNMVLLFVVKVYAPQYYIAGYLLIYTAVWIVVEIIFSRLSGIKPRFIYFSFEQAKNTISTGFFLMCGLLASNFMTGMDRWFVKGLLSTSCFAMYSFAASVEGFLGYAVSPISVTMYNYFCKNRDKEEMLRIRDVIILFSTALIGAAYCVKFILEHYLTNYTAAQGVIFILFASQLLYSVIKCLFINLYKAQKRQKEYFVKMIITVVAGIIFNCVAYLLLKQMETFAIATLCSSILWFVLCCLDFKEMQFGIKEFSFIAVEISVFIFCGYYFNSVLGFFVFYSTYILLSLLFYKKAIIYLVGLVRKENAN